MKKTLLLFLLTVFTVSLINADNLNLGSSILKGKIPFKNKVKKITSYTVNSNYLGKPAKRFLKVVYTPRIILTGKVLAKNDAGNVISWERHVRSKLGKMYRLIKRREKSIYLRGTRDLSPKQIKLYTYSLLVRRKYAQSSLKNYFLLFINAPLKVYILYVSFKTRHDGTFARKIIYALRDSIKIKKRGQTRSAEEMHNSNPSPSPDVIDRAREVEEEIQE